ncbi:unnamed protein product [Strongylus vulgaris]|uniref:NADP-dependent oxidoreductase domain-containing protein n=1 Tax=Strongylus vulgaris TaxID=40348 RepID=A0A3P7LBW9_STRVU|nr:unnamed protein product [Strongylus vulgaris]
MCILQQLLTSTRSPGEACIAIIKDTAFVYENEAVIGKVLHEYFTNGKLKREDIFITSKLPLTAHAPEDVEKVIKLQLEALQVDYIDLYLVHCPVPFQVVFYENDVCNCLRREREQCVTLVTSNQSSCREKDTFAPAIVDGLQVPVTIDHVDTWHAVEKLYDAGKVKVPASFLLFLRDNALGLSNFNAKQLQNVYDHARIKPANLQVLPFPINGFVYLSKKIAFFIVGASVLNAIYIGHKQSYSSCALGLSNFNAKQLQNVYDHARIKPANLQVLLRHLIQRGIAVIPKSVNPERNFGIPEDFPSNSFFFPRYEPCHLFSVKENFGVFDFTLSAEEMQKLDDIKTRTRVRNFSAIAHPFYPFEDVDKSKVPVVSFKAD